MYLCGPLKLKDYGLLDLGLVLLLVVGHHDLTFGNQTVGAFRQDIDLTILRQDNKTLRLKMGSDRVGLQVVSSLNYQKLATPYLRWDKLLRDSCCCCCCLGRHRCLKK